MRNTLRCATGGSRLARLTGRCTIPAAEIDSGGTWVRLILFASIGLAVWMQAGRP
jgi:hypothetical protein